MKILHLTLNRKWFDMIASGEKKEEYREIKPYWFQRLVFKHEAVFKYNTGYEYKSGLFRIEGVNHSIQKNNFGFNPFEIVSANNGYQKNCPNIKWEHKGIRIGEGKQEWGAEPGKQYFILEIGALIK